MTKVNISVPGREVATFTEEDLAQLSAPWSLIAASRARWYGSEADLETLRRTLRDDLAAIALDETMLLDLAAHDEIEIDVPLHDGSVHCARMPWEYVLPLALDRDQGLTRLSVLRHVQDATPGRLRPGAHRILFLESGPGRIGARYGFARERHIINDCFKVEPKHVLQSLTGMPAFDPSQTYLFVLPNPTMRVLRETVRHFAPDVIHVTGVDVKEGAELLRKDRSELPDEGFVMTTEDGLPEVVNARDLAGALTEGPVKPRLVAFNCYYSASQLSGLTVKHGAGSALGFLDAYDNPRVESFFDELYRACIEAQWDVPLAYTVANDSVWETRDPTRLIGAVLWRASSIGIAQPAGTRSFSDALRGVRARRREARAAPIVPPKPDESGRRQLSQLVTADVRPHAELNYSALHNRGGVFKAFALRKTTEGALPGGLKIRVTMRVGTHDLEYQHTLTLSDISEDLAGDIRLPLTWALGSVVHEAIRTTIHTSIECDQYIPIERTDIVTLLPYDEWRDADPDRAWLPSFILPRDVAVSDVLTQAQRYLPVLFDDSTASFDGYQHVDGIAHTIEEDVDLQVRALWSTLAYDLTPAYVTPPPTYSPRAQRIRTPSEILSRKRGTCIDLALLVAACLEYVEIYPVIFLLRGHAFPGYWRSPQGYNSFRVAAKIPFDSAERAQAEMPTSTDTIRHRWMLERGYYSEVMERIYQGDLVPLETTLLAQRSSFKRAVEEGMRNLKSKHEFEYLIDVNLARESQIRPLPAV